MTEQPEVTLPYDPFDTDLMTSAPAGRIDPRVEIIATWNVWNHNSKKKVVAGIEHIHATHDPDCIALQEVSPFISEIRAVAKRLGYAVIVGAKSGLKGMALQERRSTVLLRRLRIPLRRSSLIQITGKWIGPMAGLLRPGRVYPTFKGGIPPIRVVGFHGATGRKRFRRNRRTWQETLDRLGNKVEKWSANGVPIVIIGDTNDDRRNKDPESLRRFAKKHGMLLVHDDAKIDYALVKGFRAASYRSYTKMGSDTHRYGILTLHY